jgi:hypothetical protein
MNTTDLASFCEPALIKPDVHALRMTHVLHIRWWGNREGLHAASLFLDIHPSTCICSLIEIKLVQSTDN